MTTLVGVPRRELEAQPSALEPTRPISPFASSPFRLQLIMLLLLLSAVAWRKGVFFTGGVDPVVMAKAALTFAALGLAFTAPRAPGAWAGLRASPLLWVAAYLSCAIVGGTLHGASLPSIVLAVRVLLLAVALVFVMASYPWDVVISATTRAMLALAGFAIVTGAASLAATGRLYGGIPPLNANEICLLLGVNVVVIAWRLVSQPTGWLELATLPVLFGLIWLTGARTGLAALVMALMVLALLSKRLPGPVAAATAVAFPAAIYVTFFTSHVSDFASRDAASITTLSSRTVAWSAALQFAETPLQHLFGAGLAQKVIPVRAMFRNEQVLDSTWISAIVQTGYLGVLALFALLAVTAIRALSLHGSQRSLAVALVALVAVTSVMESGLLDTKPAFILFFSLSLHVHRSRPPLEAT